MAHRLLLPFRFTDIPVGSCFGLWLFQFVAVSVVSVLVVRGSFGMWPFRSWSVPECGSCDRYHDMDMQLQPCFSDC